MTIAVDLGRKATKQTNKQTNKQTVPMHRLVCPFVFGNPPKPVLTLRPIFKAVKYWHILATYDEYFISFIFTFEIEN